MADAVTMKVLYRKENLFENSRRISLCSRKTRYYLAKFSQITTKRPELLNNIEHLSTPHEFHDGVDFIPHSINIKLMNRHNILVFELSVIHKLAHNQSFDFVIAFIIDDFHSEFLVSRDLHTPFHDSWGSFSKDFHLMVQLMEFVFNVKYVCVFRGALSILCVLEAVEFFKNLVASGRNVFNFCIWLLDKDNRSNFKSFFSFFIGLLMATGIITTPAHSREFCTFLDGMRECTITVSETGLSSRAP